MHIFTNRKTYLLLALLSLFAGCHFQIHDEIKGSGLRLKQKRDVPAFTSIATEGTFDLDVVCQKPQSIELEADDNIVDLITTEVSNNVLHIRSNRSYSATDPIKVKISVAQLDGISAKGAGKIGIADIKSDKFEIDANGASTIKAAGETKLVDIDSNGAGKIDAHKLRAARGVVEAKGVARVDVNVAEQLDVTISGPSHVTYEGDPVVNKTIHGPGTVEKKEPEVSSLVIVHRKS
ncbi:MAG TPA: head GIN domain-containing protein [Pyrinomonadaceae bacterium]|nr:head GIN domain-containing protein [Pyrinomonadaceae bacterium]